MSINKGPIPQCLLPPVKPKPASVPVPVPHPVLDVRDDETIPKHRTIVVKPSCQHPLLERTRNEPIKERRRKNTAGNQLQKTSRFPTSETESRIKKTDNQKTFPCIKVEKYDDMRSKTNSRIGVVTEYLAPVIPQRPKSGHSLAPPSPLLERRSGLIPSALPQSNLSYSWSKSEGSIPDAVSNSYSRHMGSTEDFHSQPIQRAVSRDRLSPDVGNLASEFQRPQSTGSTRLSPLDGVGLKYLKSFSMQNIS